MSVVKELVGRGMKLASSSSVMRLVANDRVARVATGVLEARVRMREAAGLAKEAWRVLVSGHELPPLDPAMQEDADLGTRTVDAAAPAQPGTAATPASRRTNGAATAGGAPQGGGSNGTSPSASGAATRRPEAGNAGRNGNGNGNGHGMAAGAHGELQTAPAGSSAPRRAPTPPPNGSNGSDTLSPAEQERLAQDLAARYALARVGGRDVFEKCHKFTTADNVRKMGLYPFFKPLDFNDGPEAQLEGRRVIMLGSNNYLGLTTDPRVRQAAKDAIDKYGTSMTGSRLVNGSMRLHNELEAKIAAFHGKEAGLVFTTGYQTNIATISALLTNKKCVAVIDREVHASIYDGVRLGQALGARMVRYKHNSPESLDRALSELDASEGALVITDGVFSAQGEIAKVDAISAVVKKHGARLMVDDAHALGVIGPGGRGSAAMLGVAGDVDLIGGTFSKSLASIGGWLVGERQVLDYIQHFAFSFLFAASAAPPCVAAAMKALEIMQEEPWRQEKLRDNFTYMRNELTRLGFELGNTQTAVIPIYIRDDMRTLMMWKKLLDDHQIYTNPFITPGVPPKQQVLRTSYMATHERKHLDRALEAFETVGKQFGVIGRG